MKTRYTLLTVCLLAALCVGDANAQRYCADVFPNVCVTSNITYANNMSILTGAPVSVPLNMDIYEPCGDTVSERPLLIYIHTGSFLPLLVNGAVTGSRTDSAAVEMCKRFARRGYVVASMDYRLGWNPISTDQDTRTGTLLLAVYRAIQDAKSCVRYFKKDYVTAGNTYKIDSGRIALVGQGTGGYIAMAYATLNHPSEIQLLKFISGTTGLPYVDQTLWGDFNGLNGNPTYSTENNPGYSNHIRMVINMGGALGDSSWLEPGDVPMVAFHPISDPFAPYVGGIVIVPGYGYPVVEVSGSYKVIQKSMQAGNQAIFNGIPANCDPFTVRANQINDGLEGLFPFDLPNPGPPYFGQAGPWEWIDGPSIYALGTNMGMTTGHIDTLIGGALLTNPNILNKAHAMAYIDSILGYATPRLSLAMGLGGCACITSTHDIQNDMNVTAYPNPVNDMAYISIDGHVTIENIELSDILGNTIQVSNEIQGNAVRINTSTLSSGLYLVKLMTDHGIALQRIVKE